MLRKILVILLCLLSADGLLHGAARTPFEQYQIKVAEREAKKTEAVAQVEAFRAEIKSMREIEKKPYSERIFANRWGNDSNMHYCAILDAQTSKHDYKEDDLSFAHNEVKYIFGDLAYSFHHPYSGYNSITQGTAAGIKEIEDALKKLEDEYKVLATACAALWQESVAAAKQSLVAKFPTYLEIAPDGAVQLTDAARAQTRPKATIDLTEAKNVDLRDLSEQAKQNARYFTPRTVVAENTDADLQTCMASLHLLELAERKGERGALLFTAEGKNLLDALMQQIDVHPVQDYNALFVNPIFHHTAPKSIDLSPYTIRPSTADQEPTVYKKKRKSDAEMRSAQGQYAAFVNAHKGILEMEKDRYAEENELPKITDEFKRKLAAHELREEQEKAYQAYLAVEQNLSVALTECGKVQADFNKTLVAARNALVARFPEYIERRKGYRGYKSLQLTEDGNKKFEAIYGEQIFGPKKDIDLDPAERAKAAAFLARYNILNCAEDAQVEAVLSAQGVALLEKALEGNDRVLCGGASVEEYLTQEPEPAYGSYFEHAAFRAQRAEKCFAPPTPAPEQASESSSSSLPKREPVLESSEVITEHFKQYRDACHIQIDLHVQINVFIAQYNGSETKYFGEWQGWDVPPAALVGLSQDHSEAAAAYEKLTAEYQKADDRVAAERAALEAPLLVAKLNLAKVFPEYCTATPEYAENESGAFELCDVKLKVTKDIIKTRAGLYEVAPTCPEDGRAKAGQCAARLTMLAGLDFVDADHVLSPSGDLLLHDMVAQKDPVLAGHVSDFAALPAYDTFFQKQRIEILRSQQEPESQREVAASLQQEAAARSSASTSQAQPEVLGRETEGVTSNTAPILPRSQGSSENVPLRSTTSSQTSEQAPPPTQISSGESSSVASQSTQQTSYTPYLAGGAGAVGVAMALFGLKIHYDIAHNMLCAEKARNAEAAVEPSASEIWKRVLTNIKRQPPSRQKLLFGGLAMVLFGGFGAIMQRGAA